MASKKNLMTLSFFFQIGPSRGAYVYKRAASQPRKIMVVAGNLVRYQRKLGYQREKVRLGDEKRPCRAAESEKTQRSRAPVLIFLQFPNKHQTLNISFPAASTPIILNDFSAFFEIYKPSNMDC